jgi:hypothetical protein
VVVCKDGSDRLFLCLPCRIVLPPSLTVGESPAIMLWPPPPRGPFRDCTHPCHSLLHIRFGNGSPARKSTPRQLRQLRPRLWNGHLRRTGRGRMSKLLQSKLRGEQLWPFSRHGCWDCNEQRRRKAHREVGERKLLTGTERETSTRGE